MNLKFGFIAQRKRGRILDLLNICCKESCWRGRLKRAGKRFGSVFVAGVKKRREKEIGEWVRSGSASIYSKEGKERGG